MRHYSWARYLRLIIAFLLLCTGLGFIFGYPLWGLLLGLSGYLYWSLSQSRKLLKWLQDPDAGGETPQSIGLWGDIFDGLHRLHQTHLRTRDRLQTQINRVQESTNAMRDGVIMTDSRGMLEWWNGSAEQLLGFRRQTDRGQLIHNLIRNPGFQRYFDRADYRDTLELRSPSKPHIHLQIQISLFGANERLIVAKDVTRLVQLEQMRRDFVGNVSHEMRTPLTVISGYLETLVDHAGELPPKWRRAIRTMSDQASRMEALIADLITLSRLETAEDAAEDSIANVRNLINSVCDDARALSGENNHQFSIDIEPQASLRGDENQLRSAFSNLVFNAVKYTPSGGRITVQWTTDKRGGHLLVSDTGMGIDPIHIPRLTERFYRADPSRHQDTGGTGLGLAIVKHVLLNHDGHLEISSKPGQGSNFTCHFPWDRIEQLSAGDRTRLASAIPETQNKS
jgi:two-component system phosphate regulon sensor histidine kinase PhoR